MSVLINLMDTLSILCNTFESGDEERGHVVPVRQVGVGAVIQQQRDQLGRRLRLAGHRHAQRRPAALVLNLHTRIRYLPSRC